MLTILLLVAATAACVAVIWLSRETAAMTRAVTQLSDEVRERLIPLLEKADVTVDAANAELLRIDGAITRFEDASARVSAASNTLADVVQAPADIVTGVADRVRKAWKDRRTQAPAGASTGAQSAESDDEVDIAGERVQAAEATEPAEATESGPDRPADPETPDLRRAEPPSAAQSDPEEGGADAEMSDDD